MWHWLKENHPVAYEVAQWGVLTMAVVALVNSLVSILGR